jgi:hypothetical protein
MSGIFVYRLERRLRQLRKVKELQSDNGGGQDLQGKLPSVTAETEATASDELADRL